MMKGSKEWNQLQRERSAKFEAGECPNCHKHTIKKYEYLTAAANKYHFDSVEKKWLWDGWTHEGASEYVCHCDDCGAESIKRRVEA